MILKIKKKNTLGCSLDQLKLLVENVNNDSFEPNNQDLTKFLKPKNEIIRSIYVCKFWVFILFTVQCPLPP